MTYKRRCSLEGCTRVHYTHGYCRPHARRFRETGDPGPVEIKTIRPPGLTPEEAFRFYMPGDPPASGCWEWTASRDHHGYGHLNIAGKPRRVHCLSYEIHVGPIPPGQVVRHTCHNPPCCQPAHLLLGTQADNVADAVEAERQMRGEGHHKARLTEAQVLEIRRRAAEGERNVDLAVAFGVRQAAICDIVKRRNWKHI